MNYYQAHEILSRIKHGYKPCIKTINYALYLTGDIEECGSSGMDATIQNEIKRPWSKCSSQLVENND